MSTTAQPQPPQQPQLTEEEITSISETNQLLKIFKSFADKYIKDFPDKEFPATIALQAFVLGATASTNGIATSVRKVGQDVSDAYKFLFHVTNTSSEEGATNETN